MPFELIRGVHGPRGREIAFTPSFSMDSVLCHKLHGLIVQIPVTKRRRDQTVNMLTADSAAVATTQSTHPFELVRRLMAAPPSYQHTALQSVEHCRRTLH